MSALQIWLQNHNKRLTQDAIDEALMEYINKIEAENRILVHKWQQLTDCINAIAKRDECWDDQLEEVILKLRELT